MLRIGGFLTTIFMESPIWIPALADYWLDRGWMWVYWDGSGVNRGGSGIACRLKINYRKKSRLELKNEAVWPNLAPMARRGRDPMFPVDPIYLVRLGVHPPARADELANVPLAEDTLLM